MEVNTFTFIFMNMGFRNTLLRVTMLESINNIKIILIAEY